MIFDALASTWMPLPPQQPAVTLTFGLQNLIRSSVVANEYSLSVLSKLFKAFMRYCGNVCLDKRTNECSGRTAQKHNVFANIVGWQRDENGLELLI